ncbi:hypothetical protein AB0K51_24745 [Kitasatospora sp. NPDC049285]|uniref:hypothetical protein n=1 Tax=Kitasatospora sp. NPDC049285 TaxID=3157096 RepID=UPI00344702F0
MPARHVIALATATALAVAVPVLSCGTAVAAPTAPAASASPALPAAPVAVGATTAPAGFVGLASRRVLDTRNQYWNPDMAQGKLTAGQNFKADLGERTSHMPPTVLPVLPADATAVVVNVTVTGGTADSYLTLSAAAGDAGTVPATSSINFTAGQTVANLVTVAVTPGSTMPSVNVYNHAGSVDVVLDVVGYYRVGEANKYGPLTPVRLADTRLDAGTLGTGGVRTLQVAKPELGTADATAVVLTVTATNATTDTFLSAYPTGSYRGSSSVNVGPGQTVPNQVVVPVGADGKVDIYNNAGSADAVVDLVGYYGPSGQGLFSALKTPTRLSDTRQTSPLSPFSVRRIQATTPAGAPAGALGATLNVTATETTDYGHLIVYPDGAARPSTSNLNLTPHATVANSVTTGLGNGAFDVYNHSGQTQLITDLTGWFTTS